MIWLSCLVMLKEDEKEFNQDLMESKNIDQKYKCNEEAIHRRESLQQRFQKIYG